MDSSLRFVTTQRKRENYDLKDIENMDETPVWIKMPGKSTLEQKGKKEVRMMSTGHEKERITVVLSAPVDGTKLAPFVLLPGIRPLPKENIPSGIQVDTAFSPSLSLPLPSLLSLFLTHTLSVPFSLTPSLPLSLSRTDLTLSLSLSLLTHTHTLPLSFSLLRTDLTLSLSHTQPPLPSLSHTHTSTHSHSFISL